MVTVAPGTAFPCSSVTTPLMVARSERCARRGLLKKRHRETAMPAVQNRERKLLAMVSLRMGQADPHGDATLGRLVCD
jgi:hypothetical protein